MKISYLLPAILISLIVYWTVRWIVNKFKDEDQPPKSFRKSVRRLFSDLNLSKIDRWILVENLLAILIGFCFLTIVIYKAWLANGEPFVFDPDQLKISYSTLLILSVLCSIPLAVWVMHLLSFLLLFISFFDVYFTDVHWLRWINSFFVKDEKSGCLWLLLKFVQFFVLCFQFTLSFALSYGVLGLAFS